MGQRQLNLLGRVFFYALVGIVGGIIIGFVFGVVIINITFLVATTSYGTPPLELGAFPGMGAGAVIGGVFGGVVGYRD